MQKWIATARGYPKQGGAVKKFAVEFWVNPELPAEVRDQYVAYRAQEFCAENGLTLLPETVESRRVQEDWILPSGPRVR